MAALFLPVFARAASTTVLINEVQTGSAASASQEFVELINPGDKDIDLSGWALQYKSATSANSWSKRASLTGAIKAGGHFLVATKDYLEPDATMDDGLASAGGDLRLVDTGGAVADLVGWGTANLGEGTPAPAPAAGQSIQRLVAADTDNNQADFAINQTPDPTASDETNQGRLPGPSASGDAVISELLPDPAGSDATGEFIELHNLGTDRADLSGYKLQAGTGFNDSYALPVGSVVGAGGYLVVYSKMSHISLINSGGAARLIDPAGGVVYQTPGYGAATMAASWAMFEDGWQWTSHPTPGSDNDLAALPTPDVSSGADTTSAPAARKVTIKAVTAPKVKPAAAKTSKIKSAKPVSHPTASTLLTDAADSNQSRWLLIAALALTIGYVIYEFRLDIRNYYLVAARKLESRRKDRPTA